MTVELFGMARAIAGSPTIELRVDDRVTKAELIAALARHVPGLVGAVIDDAQRTFVEPNLLLLDGRRAPGDDESFCADDRPCILFLASGG